MNSLNEQTTRIKEFEKFKGRFEEKKDQSDHPWTQDTVLWKLVADELYLEAESMNGNDEEKRALLYHQAAHIYMVTGDKDLAGKSYQKITNEGLENPVCSK